MNENLHIFLDPLYIVTEISQLHDPLSSCYLIQQFPTILHLRIPSSHHKTIL